MALDANIGLSGIDARTAASKATNLIAGRVCDFERHKIEARERTLRRGDIDPNGARRIKPVDPRQPVRTVINIVLIAITIGCYLPKNTARNEAFQISPGA